MTTTKPRNVSTANGRSTPELAMCAAAIACEVALLAGLAGLVSIRQAIGLTLALGVFAVTRAWSAPDSSRHANYAATDRDGVVQYLGKSSAFDLRAGQHQADSRGGRNGAPKDGKDWAVILNEGGALEVYGRYRTPAEALRVERRMTYTFAVAVYWVNALGQITGLLPPRIFGNRANTPYARNSGGLRPWEWAAIPLFAVGYLIRPHIEHDFPNWAKWTR